MVYRLRNPALHYARVFSFDVMVLRLDFKMIGLRLGLHGLFSI